MKPFDLEKALAGEPLVHKESGVKAYLVGESKFLPRYSVIEFEKKVQGIGFYKTILTALFWLFFIPPYLLWCFLLTKIALAVWSI
ncbi:hypothetical protein ACLSZ3_04695 [Avibacterium gallinarum]|uniref:hypothetical protein n=1 Tax=Avibacterium gallinarum TaxID=755 RepID=UPI003BF891D8